MVVRQLVTLLIFTCVSIALASIATAQVCPPSGVAGFSQTDDIIYIYMESDFATELTAANNNSVPSLTDDDAMTGAYWLRNALHESLDAWNMQSKGPELRFGGYVSTSTPQSGRWASPR